jgi:hypothetical protein
MFVILPLLFVLVLSPSTTYSSDSDIGVTVAPDEGRFFPFPSNFLDDHLGRRSPRQQQPLPKQLRTGEQTRRNYGGGDDDDDREERDNGFAHAIGYIELFFARRRRGRAQLLPSVCLSAVNSLFLFLSTSIFLLASFRDHSI